MDGAINSLNEITQTKKGKCIIFSTIFEKKNYIQNDQN